MALPSAESETGVGVGVGGVCVASREVGGDRISTGLQADEDYPEAVFAARSV